MEFHISWSISERKGGLTVWIETLAFHPPSSNIVGTGRIHPRHAEGDVVVKRSRGRGAVCEESGDVGDVTCGEHAGTCGFEAVVR